MANRRVKIKHAAVLALTLGAAAAGGARCLRAQEMSEAQAAAVRRGVQATMDAYRELAGAGKWDELMRLYADDPRFRWVSRGTVEARSVEQIRKALTGLPPGTRAENTFQDLEITPLAPGVAAVTTLFRTRVIEPNGHELGFGGAMTMTLVERPEGWRILYGHSSSPPPRGPAGR